MVKNQFGGYDLIPQQHEFNFNFYTVDNVWYSVGFIPLGDNSNLGPLAPHVYVCGISPLDGFEPPDKQDPKIGATMANLVEWLMKRDPQAVVTFICSTDEDQEVVRLRTFRRYFNRFNRDKRYTKDEFSDPETRDHGAFIYRNGNLFVPQIQDLVQNPGLIFE